MDSFLLKTSSEMQLVSYESMWICFQKNIEFLVEVLRVNVWIHDFFSLKMQNGNKNLCKSH